MKEQEREKLGTLINQLGAMVLDVIPVELNSVYLESAFNNSGNNVVQRLLDGNGNSVLIALDASFGQLCFHIFSIFEENNEAIKSFKMHIFMEDGEWNVETDFRGKHITSDCGVNSPTLSSKPTDNYPAP